MKPLPYRDPGRLANIWVDLGVGNQSLPAVSPGDFRDYQQRSQLFESFAAGTGPALVGATGALAASEGRDTERVDVTPVTANFFSLLGVDPMLGRHFSAEEETPGGPQVAILSYALWARRYAGDRSIVGRRIRLDGLDHTVVGVMPETFSLLLPAEAFLVTDAQIWKPLRFDYSQAPPRNFTLFTVFGRLKPDVTFAQAQAEMDGIARQLRQEHAEHESSDMRIRVVPLQDDIVKHTRPALIALLGAVAVRAAHRVRQRGAPAARALDGAPARDGAARGARRPAVCASSGNSPPRASCWRRPADSWAWCWRKAA